MKSIQTLKSVALLSGALAIAVATVPVDSAHAAKVKCYGISKAGHNDCASASGSHACAGHSTVDYDGGEWKIAVSPEACTEKGGQLKSFKGINPNIS